MSDQKNPAVAPPADQKTVARMVTELKVSANLMTLDAGLFCIFNAPGSPVPDPGTGLPGVRVSAPPGPVFRPEAVTITSFRDDGWLGGWNGAALVRVTRGPAQILVTIYQAPNSTADAPRLQILRLAESAALPPIGVPTGPVQGQPQALQRPLTQVPAPAGGQPPAPVQPAGPAAANNPQNTPASAAQTDADAAKAAEIVSHIQGRGDVVCRLGEWMGVPGSRAWIEGFAVAPKGPVGPADVEYQAVLGRGWLSPWAEGGQFCGSRGMSLPILGLRMRLRGEAAERFDCVVSASFVDGTKVGPLDNGDPCQAESMAPLEAFNIILTPRADVSGMVAPAAEMKEADKPAGKSARAKAAPAAPLVPKPPARPRTPVMPTPKPPKAPVRGRK